ncbi:unnamed protein product, partial [Nesidiocoris tenuis]
MRCASCAPEAIRREFRQNSLDKEACPTLIDSVQRSTHNSEQTDLNQLTEHSTKPHR